MPSVKAFPDDFTQDTSPTGDTYLLGSGGKLKASTLVGSGVGANTTTLAVNGSWPADSLILRVTVADVYAGLTAQTTPSQRWVMFEEGGHLVPYGYPASTQEINGGGVNAIWTSPAKGLYAVVGDGANAWTVIRAASDAISDFAGTHATPSGSDNFAAGWQRGSIILDSSGDVYFCTGDGVWALLTPDLNFIPNTTGAVSTTLISDGAVTDAKIRSGIATSVIGRSVGSSGQVGDIQAAADDLLFARVSGVLQFVQLTIGMVADRLLTWAKMPAGGALSVIGRSANSSGDVADIAAGNDGDVLRRSGTTLGFGKLTAAGHDAQTDGSLHAAATTSVAGFMSTTQVTRQNGLVQSYDPLASFPSYQTIQSISGICHFTENYYPLPFAIQSNGTGATMSNGTAVAGRVGICSVTTGTTTTGSSSVFLGATAIVFGSGVCRYREDVLLSTASDGTDTYIKRAGFNDSSPTVNSDGVDGAFFRYTHSVNGGRWECVTRSNSSETATDSGVAGISASYQCLEIEVNAAGTSVVFKINGTTVATNSANIPTGASRATGINSHIIKSAGTTSRSFDIDLAAYHCEMSAAI